MKELKALEILKNELSDQEDQLTEECIKENRLSRSDVEYIKLIVNNIKEAIAELEALQTPKTCEYESNDDSYHGTVYNFNCGYSYVTVEGDLSENGIKFCPYCGGLAKEKAQ